MKKKIFLILAILLVLGGYLIYLFGVWKDENNINNTTNNIDEMSGTNSKEGEENFYDWETKLNIRILEIFNEVYPENYEFNLKNGETFEVNLNTLEKKHRKDISEFNTEEVKCDIYLSKVIVSKDEEGILRGAKVACEKID